MSDLMLTLSRMGEMWLTARWLRRLTEVACDERSLAGWNAQQRRHYGEVLISLASSPGGSMSLAMHSVVPSFGADLPYRLRALRRQRRWPAALQGILLVALGGFIVACSGMGENETPRIVTTPAPVVSAKKIALPTTSPLVISVWKHVW